MEITYNGGPACGHLDPQQALLMGWQHPLPGKKSKELSGSKTAVCTWSGHCLTGAGGRGCDMTDVLS